MANNHGAAAVRRGLLGLTLTALVATFSLGAAPAAAQSVVVTYTATCIQGPLSGNALFQVEVHLWTTGYRALIHNACGMTQTGTICDLSGTPSSGFSAPNCLNLALGGTGGQPFGATPCSHRDMQGATCIFAAVG